MTFWTRASEHCFLRGPLRWLTEQKNPKFLRSLQNAQRDITNFVVRPKDGQHQYYFLLTISLYNQERKFWELTKWSLKGKCFDLLSYLKLSYKFSQLVIILFLNPLSPKSDQHQIFSLVISILCKTEWSWELWTWSQKMNFLDVLSTSPHYFCGKWIGVTNENSKF